MKNPILLQSGTMDPAATLHPISCALQDNDTPPSTCTLVLPPEDAEVRCGDWVLLTTPQGKDMVMVVRTAQTNYNTGLRTMALDHAMTLLNDCMVVGKHTPEDLAGEGSTTVSLQTAITFLLNQQHNTLWAMGDLELSTAQGWTFNNKSVYTCLLELTNSVDACYWDFDFTSLPWKLSLRQQDTTTIQAEMRADRNLSTMQLTLDRSKMCTRLYPQGESSLTIGAANGGKDYIEMNTDVWGVVEKVQSNKAISDASSLLRWGQKELKKLCNPIVTITISALELGDITGEPLDRLLPGRWCRIPLPGYNTTVEERIISVNWADAVSAPTNVRITMANSPTTLQGVLYKLQTAAGGGGGGGGGGGTSELEDEIKDIYTIFEVTDDHILSQAVAKRAAQLAWSKVYQTADQIQSTVQQYNYNDAGDLLENYYTQITQNAAAITTKAESADVTSLVEQTAASLTSTIQSTEEGLQSQITQTKNSLTSTITDTANDLQSQITQAANIIKATVGTSAASITGDGITLSAGTITLDGATVVEKLDLDKLKSRLAKLEALNVGNLTVTGYINAQDSIVGVGTMGAGAVNVDGNVSAATFNGKKFHTLAYGDTSVDFLSSDDMTIPEPDLSGYYTKAEVDTLFQNFQQAIVNTLASYVKSDDLKTRSISDTVNGVTYAYNVYAPVSDAVTIPEEDLSDYAKVSDLDSYLKLSDLSTGSSAAHQAILTVIKNNISDGASVYTTIKNKLDDVYAAASHTHSYTTDITNKPTIPTVPDIRTRWISYEGVNGVSYSFSVYSPSSDGVTLRAPSHTHSGYASSSHTHSVTVSGTVASSHLAHLHNVSGSTTSGTTYTGDRYITLSGTAS